MNDPAPRWLWRGVLGGVLAGCVLVGMLAGALAQGAADPARPFAHTWQDTDLHWGRGGLPERAPVRLPDGAFALDLSATIHDPALVWGVWLQTEAGYYAIFAISAEGSTGYVTARLCPSLAVSLAACATFTEANQGIQTGWKTALYLMQPGKTNRISLDYAVGRVRLRLNHEWMWDVLLHPGETWGVWMPPGGEVAWQEARLLW